jgi:hypothetical protein
MQECLGNGPFMLARVALSRIDGPLRACPSYPTVLMSFGLGAIRKAALPAAVPQVPARVDWGTVQAELALHGLMAGAWELNEPTMGRGFRVSKIGNILPITA